MFLKNKKEQKIKRVGIHPKESKKGQSKLIGIGKNVNKKEGQELNSKKTFFKFYFFKGLFIY